MKGVQGKVEERGLGCVVSLSLGLWVCMFVGVYVCVYVYMCVCCVLCMYVYNLFPLPSSSLSQISRARLTGSLFLHVFFLEIYEKICFLFTIFHDFSIQIKIT